MLLENSNMQYGKLLYHLELYNNDFVTSIGSISRYNSHMESGTEFFSLVDKRK